MSSGKIFGIGFHKTGTKSLGRALEVLGYSVCAQVGTRDEDIASKVYQLAFSLTDKFDAFQDNPWPLLFKELDSKYPGSKFILTMRPIDKWIESVVKYFGTEDTPMRKWIYGAGHPKRNEHIYINRHLQHLVDVLIHFKERPDDLLIISITEGEGWEKLCPFLNMGTPSIPFPHVNKGANNATSSSNPEKRHSMVGPGALWKMKRDFQIQFLKQEDLKPEYFLLDIGCGTLRGGIPIIRYLNEGHYYGIEVRADVLEEGKKELHEAQIENKKSELILYEDFRTLKIDRLFDIIWAFSVLIHMSDEIVFHCFNFISRHLNKTGSFYANLNIGERKELSWQDFPVHWRPSEFYEELASVNDLNFTDMGTLKELGHFSNIDSQDRQRMFKFSKT